LSGGRVGREEGTKSVSVKISADTEDRGEVIVMSGTEGGKTEEAEEEAKESDDVVHSGGEEKEGVAEAAAEWVVDATFETKESEKGCVVGAK
jgi:hypothetical protein